MNSLNLIRYKNLLFIAALQCLMYYCIIEPVLLTFQINNPMSGFQFLLLLCSTLCIAAGGYVINDYFDTRIDEINKPDKVIIGKLISKKTASLLHQILTGIGVLSGIIVAYSCRSFTLGLIIVMVPGLLWFYSASYKRQFLIGNLVVALNAAFALLVVAIATASFLSNPQAYGDLIYETPIIRIIYTWVCGFAIFAFLSTLIREIIKDMEDIKGDREMESRTMPIVLGIAKSKMVLYALIVVTLALLFYLQFQHIDKFIFFGTEKSSLSLRYLIFGISLPFAFLSYLIIKAKGKRDFHQASTFVKFIMGLGSLYSLVFYFLLAKAQGLALFGLFLIK